MIPMFSIIVPVYNVKTRIKTCIDSVLSQTIGDYELVLIDDGSTDGSGDICQDSALNDKRIKVYHQENGGVSSARNRGLDVAKGEYVVFLDGDDYLPNNALEIFKEEDSDLVIGSVRELDQNESELCFFKGTNDTYSLDNEDAIIRFYKEWYAHQIWARKYKRAIIETNHLRFDEEVNFGEDVLFNMSYILMVSEVRTVNELVYNWCRTSESRLSDPGSFWTQKLDLMTLKLLEIYKDMPNMKKAILNKFWWTIENRIHSIAKSEYSDEDKIVQISELIKAATTQKCIISGVIKTNRIVKRAIVHNNARFILRAYK